MQQISFKTFFTDEKIKEFLMSRKLSARSIAYCNESGEVLDIEKFEEYFTVKPINNGSVPDIFEKIKVLSKKRENSNLAGDESIIGSIHFKDLDFCGEDEDDNNEFFYLHLQGRMFFDSKRGILRYFDPIEVIAENPYQEIWEIRKN